MSPTGRKRGKGTKYFLGNTILLLKRYGPWCTILGRTRLYLNLRHPLRLNVWSLLGLSNGEIQAFHCGRTSCSCHVEALHNTMQCCFPSRPPSSVCSTVHVRYLHTETRRYCDLSLRVLQLLKDRCLASGSAKDVASWSMLHILRSRIRERPLRNVYEGPTTVENYSMTFTPPFSICCPILLLQFNNLQ